MTRAMCLALSLAWPGVLAAQDVPGTDIYLVSMTRYQCPVQVGEPVNVTARPGYDNQPSFLPDRPAILYTSIREDGQADTYRYAVRSGETSRVTRTAESEYSPTVMPGGARFSTVRVEADSTQRLWSFALDGSDPELVIPDVAPVGYHTWANARHVALFVLGDPPTLQVVESPSGTPHTVADNVGRSLHGIPGRNAVSFLHRESDAVWIKEYDVESGEIRPLKQPIGDGEDYAWNADGELLMADGSVVYGARCDGGDEWEALADFSAHGIRGITRLAVSADGRWLAMVADDERTEGR